MFGFTTSTLLMPFHTICMAIILMVLGRFISYVLPTLPQCYSTSSSEAFPLTNDFRDYRYDIGNSFHDCNHDQSSSMSTSLR